MAYNDFLAGRVRLILDGRRIPYTESISFGQLNFTVNGLFCAGVSGDDLEICVAPETVTGELPGRRFRLLDESGRHLKGFISIDPVELELDGLLEEWIGWALEYNRKQSARGKSAPRRVKGCRTPGLQ